MKINIEKALKIAETAIERILFKAAATGSIPQRLYRYFQRKHWEEISDDWENLKPPFRPSGEDLAHYKKLIEFCAPRAKRILLLGSTPELRDMLGDIFEKIIVVDFSKFVMKSLSRFLKSDKKRNETLIQYRWEKLNFLFHDFFDIVIGDVVLDQFPPKEESIFLVSVRDILKRDGRFIMRAICRRNEENSNKVIRTGLRWWAPPTKRELWKKLEIYFTVKKEMYSSDYNTASNFPLLCLLPKKESHHHYKII